MENPDAASASPARSRSNAPLFYPERNSQTRLLAPRSNAPLAWPLGDA